MRPPWTAMGFAPGEGLLVIGDNRPRLYFGMLGAAALRGLPAPVYPGRAARRSASSTRATAGARFALAEDQEQVDKLLELRERIGPARDHRLRRSPRALPTMRSRASCLGRACSRAAPATRLRRAAPARRSHRPRQADRTPPCCCTRRARPASPRALCCSIAA